MTMKVGMRRRNGRYGTAAWMRKIAEKRSPKNIPHGEDHFRAKICTSDVRFIRNLPAPVSRSIAEKIARVFNISAGYVYHLRARKRWKHI